MVIGIVRLPPLVLDLQPCFGIKRRDIDASSAVDEIGTAVVIDKGIRVYRIRRFVRAAFRVKGTRNRLAYVCLLQVGRVARCPSQANALPIITTADRVIHHSGSEKAGCPVRAIVVG